MPYPGRADTLPPGRRLTLPRALERILHRNDALRTTLRRCGASSRLLSMLPPSDLYFDFEHRSGPSRPNLTR